MYLQDLSDKIWKTKNARFIAAQRIKRSRISSTASVALLSASIIAINMLAFLNVSEDEKTRITIGTVVLSTFALVMSLLVTLMRYEHREDNYTQCGIELENLNQRLRIRINELLNSGNKTDEIISPKDDDEKFLKEYSDILRKYNQNHTEFDYQYSLLKAESTKEHGFWKTIGYWFRWYILDVNVLYWLLAIVPIVVIIITFCNILSLVQ